MASDSFILSIEETLENVMSGLERAEQFSITAISIIQEATKGRSQSKPVKKLIRSIKNNSEFNLVKKELSRGFKKIHRAAVKFNKNIIDFIQLNVNPNSKRFKKILKKRELIHFRKCCKPNSGIRRQMNQTTKRRAFIESDSNDGVVSEDVQLSTDSVEDNVFEAADSRVEEGRDIKRLKLAQFTSSSAVEHRDERGEQPDAVNSNSQACSSVLIFDEDSLPGVFEEDLFMFYSFYIFFLNSELESFQFDKPPKTPPFSS